MKIAMWISALLHWLIVSPGMHKQSEFPMKLFLARLAILSPLLGWVGWVWPIGMPELSVVIIAGPLAVVTDLTILLVQALGQAALSDSKDRY